MTDEERRVDYIMKLEKKIASELRLCYCVAPLTYRGRQHFLVASEKEYACLLFDEDGNLVDKIWDGPGGTMSMVQIPGTDGAFLATHEFYSPNNSLNAKIVMVWPEGGTWRVRTLAELPCVHRFDILTRDGVNYLLACCLKSGYEQKDDWRFPGMTLACRLPENLLDLPEGEMLTFDTLKDKMLKNHGYFRSVGDEGMSGIVACEEGVFRFTPPAKGGNWEIQQLIAEGTSDGILADFDGCGQEELLTIQPFHGDKLAIYKRNGEAYQKVWEYDHPTEFAHGICVAEINGKAYGIVGHRKGERDLLAIFWKNGGYAVELLDHNVGPANVVHSVVKGKHILLSANREIDEIAYYTVLEE